MDRKIIATPNYRKRTFTIRIYYKEGSKTKYRTLPMNKQEFENNNYNTENDWNAFLRHSQNYYYIKN